MQRKTQAELLSEVRERAPGWDQRLKSWLWLEAAFKTDQIRIIAYLYATGSLVHDRTPVPRLRGNDIREMESELLELALNSESFAQYLLGQQERRIANAPAIIDETNDGFLIVVRPNGVKERYRKVD